jgi:hypothetical protein
MTQNSSDEPSFPTRVAARGFGPVSRRPLPPQFARPSSHLGVSLRASVQHYRRRLFEITSVDLTEARYANPKGIVYAGIPDSRVRPKRPAASRGMVPDNVMVHARLLRHDRNTVGTFIPRLQ